MRQTRGRNKQKKEISSQYFVGYVEDDESIEAIMKKFEELDSIKAEHEHKKKKDGEPEQEAEVSLENKEEGGEEGLPEDVLLEVFKRTSAFTVKGAMMNDEDIEVLNDVELWRAEFDGDTAEFEEEDDYYNFDDNDMWDEEFGVFSKNKSKGRKLVQKGEKLGLREQILQRYKYMQIKLKDQSGRTFYVKRKVNMINPFMPTYIRIPPDPIPLSWAKTIRASKKDKIPQYSRSLTCPSVVDFDWSSFERTYHAIYMDPQLLIPGELSGNPQQKNSKMQISLLRNIPVSKLVCPGGFVFIWSEKELFPQLFELAENSWKLKYVENFCWIKKHPNNQIAKLPSRAHGELEMRHQRSPDCVFDFIKPKNDAEEPDYKPEFMYKVIETLLPNALCSESNPDPDRLLQL
ncbi:hypothetical protein AX774_g1323 [Zancudomyces culisetae]|uniref:Uncharacterized protein n=1 Tax=Zancudomyces culisetae TaxID=1213189 RepID=A0A1R1PW14_ZANCU|nr:hypothetical protein AX774_g1323 [Zancudomyces culisetae]|eukprot:OMH85138.1 hypothetical protein AX774_g1323 [Zancudomyces culisetae]